MIIVLKNADFSQSNIGTLSTWRISRSLGAGATYAGPTSVDKRAALSATVTIAEGYEVGTAGVTITMGGTVLSGAHSISGNVITITIASVTGNVLIKVPTVNVSGGEEDIDITALASFENGATNAEGAIVTSSYFQTASIDVSAYRGKTIEFTFIKYTGSTGKQSNNYCGFVNSSGEFTSAIQAPVCDLGNTKGESYVATVTIPTNAVTFKTSWFVQNAVEQGVYSGSVSDFYVIVKNGGSGTDKDENDSGSSITFPVNLTAIATSEDGAMTTKGANTSSSYFQTMIVDVSAYRGYTLEFTFIKYASSTGEQSSNACGFFDDSGTFTLAEQAPVSNLGNKKGELYTTTAVIPSTATTFKTTWFKQDAVDGGVYSGSVSDFSIIVKNS